MGERNRLYIRIDFSSIHLNMSTGLEKPRPPEEFVKNTSQFAEGLRLDAAPRHHHNIKTLPQAGMQFHQYRPKAPFETIANDGDAMPPANHDAITIAQMPVGAEADEQGAMPLNFAASPGAREI